MQEETPTEGEEPNPYEPPQSDERPVRDLAKRLGVVGSFIVAGAMVLSGIIGALVSCTTVVAVGLPIRMLGERGDLALLKLVVPVAELTGLIFGIYIARRVQRRLTKRLSR
ncbi:hypothetical protein Pla175_06870 [Pirellulimonas nuda]|uniref:Uncharacterized protein n=1 Tax=Pirellulimonas nuda TaxID=2528009 RepID=A0A518D766_9BACT|nr:hypothetical protein [Pirellulimonas nuda]QDU87328.1 hypothetical protein Pla175_06870 [Pirellulimonas nuda]